VLPTLCSSLLVPQQQHNDATIPAGRAMVKPNAHCYIIDNTPHSFIKPLSRVMKSANTFSRINNSFLFYSQLNEIKNINKNICPRASANS
jgi:hypothetical protein